MAELLAPLLQIIQDQRLMVMALTAVAAIATVLTLAMPLLQNDSLGRRMKTVAVERSKIRARERERLAQSQVIALRRAPKPYMKQIVERLDLSRWLGTDDARVMLVRAGFRSPSAMVTFLFFRMVTPIVLLVLTVFYVFLVLDLDWPLALRIGLCLVAAYLGVKAPEIYLKNSIGKRQVSIQRSWPDALDLLLICVESGMSIEQAFKKVSGEVGAASLPLAEELGLTTAELSYLQDRRQAYDNLAHRTGLEGVKAVCVALVQSERYGTSLGQSLRVLAQENRDMRMIEAEKKAAKLPPMLTVPLIVFFLPVLFVVIMGPALIQVFHWN